MRGIEPKGMKKNPEEKADEGEARWRVVVT